MDGLLEGLGLGLLGGMVAWAAAQALLRPRIRCSLHISKQPNPSAPCGYAYRVKIKNASFLRSLADVRLQARVYLRHRNESGSTTGRNLRLGTWPSDVFRILPREHVILRIDPAALSSESNDRLRSWGYDIAERADRSLEDYLRLPDAYFSVQMRGTDGWSGAAHFKETPRLRLGDRPILEARFVARRNWVDRVVHRLNQHRSEASNKLERHALLRRSHPELRVRAEAEAEHADHAGPAGYRNDMTEHDELPLPDYDHLPTGSLEGRIRSLTADQVGTLLAYEGEHAARPLVLRILQARIDQLQAGAEPTGGSPDAARPETAQHAEAPGKASPETTGPPINPPSQGVPTNPSQPRG